MSQSSDADEEQYEQIPIHFKNGMMFFGCIHGSSEKVYAEFRNNNPENEFLWVDAKVKKSKVCFYEQINEEPIPDEIITAIDECDWETLTSLYTQGSVSDHRWALKNLSVAEMDALERFDNVKKCMGEAKLGLVAEAMAKGHPRGWEPSLKMLKQCSTDAMVFGTVPSHDKELEIFMAIKNEDAADVVSISAGDRGLADHSLPAPETKEQEKFLSSMSSFLNAITQKLE